MSVDYESGLYHYNRKKIAFLETGTHAQAHTSSYQKQANPFRTAAKFSADANLFFTPKQIDAAEQSFSTQNTGQAPRSDFEGVKLSLKKALPELSTSENFLHDSFEYLKQGIVGILDGKKLQIMQKLSRSHEPIVQELDRRMKLVDSLQSWATENSELTDLPQVRPSLYEEPHFDSNKFSIAEQIGKFDDLERHSNNKKEMLKQISSELERLQTDAAFEEIKKVSRQPCPYINKGEIQTAIREILSRFEQNTSQFFGDHKVFCDQTFVPLDVNSLKSEFLPLNTRTSDARTELQMKQFEDLGSRFPATGTLAQIAFSTDEGFLPIQHSTTAPTPNPKLAKPRAQNQNLSAMVLSNLSTLKAAPAQPQTRLSAVQLYCARQQPQSAHATQPVASTAGTYTAPSKPHTSRILRTPDSRTPLRPPSSNNQQQEPGQGQGQQYHQQQVQQQHPQYQQGWPSVAWRDPRVGSLGCFSGADGCLDAHPPTCVVSLEGRPGWAAVGTSDGRVLLTDFAVQRVLAVGGGLPVTLLDGGRPGWLFIVLAGSRLHVRPLDRAYASHAVEGDANASGDGALTRLEGSAVVRDVLWDAGRQVWVVACSDGRLRTVREGFDPVHRVFEVAPGKQILLA